MKRVFCILAASAFLFCLLAACTEKAVEQSTPTIQPEQSEIPAQSEAPVQNEEPVPSTEPETEPPKTRLLNDVYHAIMNAQEGNGQEVLVLFPESNPDALDSYYPGLSAIELTQQAFYMPPVYGHACEIMLVEVTNESDVDTVKDIFQARIDQAASDTAYPENAEPWARNAQVQSAERYVCMIVLPDGYTVPEDVFALA